MNVMEAVHVAQVAGTLRCSRVDLDDAKRVLEDLLAKIEQTLADAPSEMVTGE